MGSRSSHKVSFKLSKSCWYSVTFILSAKQLTSVATFIFNITKVNKPNKAMTALRTVAKSLHQLILIATLTAIVS